MQAQTEQLLKCGFTDQTVHLRRNYRQRFLDKDRSYSTGSSITLCSLLHNDKGFSAHDTSVINDLPHGDGTTTGFQLLVLYTVCRKTIVFAFWQC